MKNNTYHVFFKNLANPLRISIVSELKNKESSVGEAMTPTPWKTKINIFRVLIIKIMRWIKKMF